MPQGNTEPGPPFHPFLAYGPWITDSLCSYSQVIASVSGRRRPPAFGTMQFSAGYPQTNNRYGFSFSGRPQISCRNVMGLGV